MRIHVNKCLLSISFVSALNLELLFLFSHSVVSDSVTPRTAACQAPLSLGFPRQEYWSKLPFPSPGDLSNLGIKAVSPVSPALAGGFFTTKATWKVPFCGLVATVYSLRTK